VTTRAKLQAAYELAFFPPRLHQLWSRIKHGRIEDEQETVELLEMALTLHRALPERGYSSMRALKRLAYYQAASRCFAPVTFLYNVYKRFTGRDPDLPDEVPGDWVRDIGLPEFSHHREGSRGGDRAEDSHR
jgi:hypothetical protein